MGNKKDTSVYQLDNGYWAYRYKINIDGVAKEKRSVMFITSIASSAE